MENNVNNPTPQVEETPKAKKPINAKLIIIIVAIVAIIAAAGIGVAVGSADKDGQKSGNKSDVEAAEKGDSDKDDTDKDDKGHADDGAVSREDAINNAIDIFMQASIYGECDDVEALMPTDIWNAFAEEINRSYSDAIEEAEDICSENAFVNYAGDIKEMDYTVNFLENTDAEEFKENLEYYYDIASDDVDDVQLVEVELFMDTDDGELEDYDSWYMIKIDGQWYCCDGGFLFY